MDIFPKSSSGTGVPGTTYKNTYDMVIFRKLISAAQVPLLQPKTKYMFGLSPLDLTAFLLIIIITPHHPSSLLAHVDLTASPTVKTNSRGFLKGAETLSISLSFLVVT